MNVAKIKFINLFFILYFLLGLLIYKDFGIGIEEHFQRQNGFYWLKEILKKWFKSVLLIMIIHY